MAEKITKEAVKASLLNSAKTHKLPAATKDTREGHDIWLTEVRRVLTSLMKSDDADLVAKFTSQRNALDEERKTYGQGGTTEAESRARFEAVIKTAAAGGTGGKKDDGPVPLRAHYEQMVLDSHSHWGLRLENIFFKSCKQSFMGPLYTSARSRAAKLAQADAQLASMIRTFRADDFDGWQIAAVERHIKEVFVPRTLSALWQIQESGLPKDWQTTAENFQRVVTEQMDALLSTLDAEQAPGDQNMETVQVKWTADFAAVVKPKLVMGTVPTGPRD